MVERRISKTPEQIRAEAVAAADADLKAFAKEMPEVEWKQETFVSLYKWNFERIEREATTYYSMGMPIAEAAAQQYPGFTSWPFRGTPQPLPAIPSNHVCEFDMNLTLPTCKTCGAMYQPAPSIVVVGP